MLVHGILNAMAENGNYSITKLYEGGKEVGITRMI